MLWGFGGSRHSPITASLFICNKAATFKPYSLSSPTSTSASSQASPLRSQVLAVSSDESHSVTPQRIRTAVQVNPPPQEDELWPDPPPPVCHDIHYRAREERGFPISYATSISRSNRVQLAAKKSVAQPIMDKRLRCL